MRFSRVFGVTAALCLAAALSALPAQLASAQPPSTQVLVPSTGATVSGTQVVLDASASAGVTKVQFELTGGTLNDLVIATATPTIYGWIAVWNSTTVVGGGYTLQSVATTNGSSATSTGISIYVIQGGPTLSFVLPSGTVSGTQAVFDAVGLLGVSHVGFAFSAPGCPPTGPPGDQQPLCTFSATPTIYGWIAVWNSTEVPNGSYEVSATCGQCGASFPMTGMEVANPAATVVVPANGSTVAGSQLLDCVPPAGYDGVQFWIEGPSLSGSQFVGAATPTYYGWLFEWNSASVADGYYSIYCTAGSPSTGAAAFSPTILVNVGPVP
jgi:hypothetical protein